MDPLSVTSGILAVLTASGHTLQGLQKLVELRHRDKEFAWITDSINRTRSLMAIVEFALNQFQPHLPEAEPLRDYLHNLKAHFLPVKEAVAELDRLIRDLQPPDNGVKPPKLRWMRRKLRLVHQAEQVENAAKTLATTVSILHGVRGSTISLLAPVRDIDTLSEVVLSAESSTALVDNNIYCPNLVGDSRLTSQASLYTATSEMEFLNFTPDIDQSTPTDPLLSVNTLNGPSISLISPATPQCRKLCQCSCHTFRHFQTPRWANLILGSFTFHGNGSIWLKRRECDKSLCKRSGSLRVQFAYATPKWMAIKDFLVCAHAYGVGNSIPTFNISFPRVIPYQAVAWSFVELGSIIELQKLFSQGLASPYDVNPSGTSLLKYAVIKDKIDVCDFLLKKEADPFMRDNHGGIAVQPGIDRALLNQLWPNQDHTNDSANLFLTDDNLEQQDFSTVHLITLGMLREDLSTALELYPLDVNSVDANGRTALHWAAWRGDKKTLEILLQHGAAVNKTDLEGFTPLARAASGGHLESVHALLNNKPSLTLATCWGDQPIHLASGNKDCGHLIVKALLDAGDNPNAFGYGTPLHSAANHGSLETVKLLLEQGANIDAFDRDGDTAAMVALSCWKDSIFQYLARAGARLDTVNKSCINILQLATWTASVESWEMIIELARSGTLGLINTKALHDGHDIEQCFSICRKRWYVGERQAEEVERASFDMLIQIVNEADWVGNDGGSGDRGIAAVRG